MQLHSDFTRYTSNLFLHVRVPRPCSRLDRPRLDRVKRGICHSVLFVIADWRKF